MTIESGSAGGNRTLAAARHTGKSVGVAAAPTPVVRSPADILRLVVAVVTLLVVIIIDALFGGTVVGFAHDLLRGADAFSKTFITTVVVMVRVTTLGFLVS